MKRLKKTSKANVRDESKTKKQLIDELKKLRKGGGDTDKTKMNGSGAGDKIKRTLSLLNATLESTADGILVVDRKGKITLFNQKLIEMWRIPESVIRSKDDKQVLTFFLCQIMHPQVFLTKIKELYNQPSAESFHILEFKNQRTFELYSHPQWIGKECVGRVWSFRDATERRRAEEALRESENRYRTAIEHSNDGVAIIREKKYVFVNQKLAEILGYDGTHEIEGKPVTSFIHPENIKESETRIHKREKGEYVPPRFEFTGVRRNGTPVHLEVSSNQTVYRGEPALLAYMRDITERKQAQEELEISEIRYRKLFESAKDGILLMDAESGKITEVNPHLLKISGYPQEEYLGKRLWEMDFFKGLADDPTGFIKLRDAQYIRYKHLPLETKNGTQIDVEFVSNVYQVDHHSVIQCHIRDITERRRAEEALRESEDRYRTAIEHSNDGVAILKGNRHLFVNQKFVEIFGYDDPEEVINRPLSAVVHPDHLSRVEETTQSRQKGIVAPSRYDFKGIRKNGELIDIEVSASQTLYRGEPVSLVYLRDITERKLAEREMINLQQQLRHSQKMEAIGRLAGGIAHDINNLLTVIKGYSQLSLIEAKGNPSLKEKIDEIKKASDHAADLIGQLLAFSRRQIMEMKVLHLNGLVQNLDKILRRIIGEDIELVTVLDENLGCIKTDPGQMEQILMNLAVNARDAMPEGGKLTVETANMDLDETYTRSHVSVEPGRYVMISMSDTGMGMTPEVRERIFEPFFTTKETGQGTGLGLSTVYGIVKQSKGNIWVYSEPGQGTTFKIYLPRIDESPEECKEKIVKEELPCGTETILVVEDEHTVLKLTVEILQSQGYKVLAAPDGESALAVWKEQKDPIHMILTDVIMPGMSGRQLVNHCEEIRTGFKVLYMSGYTENAIVHHGVLKDRINYIQKPFTIEALTRKVRDVLDENGPLIH